MRRTSSRLFIQLLATPMYVLVALLLSWHLSSSTGVAAADRAPGRQKVRQLRFLDDETPLPLLIGYKTRPSPSSALGVVSPLQDRSSVDLGTSASLLRVNATKAKLNRVQVQELLDLDGEDGDILYIEEDTLVYPFAETITYGIEFVQALGQYPPVSNRVAACNDPNSFRVGIVDSGFDVQHPDLPCSDIDAEDTNCKGESFGLGLTDEWSAPSDIHGTAVAGIIGAIRGNDVGIMGVLNNDNVCYIIARVFGGSVSEARMSDILDAVEWVVEQGASVINLSLGGPDYSQTAENFYDSVRSQDRLVVCASGNDGTTDLLYPASFSSTVSVGAIDQNRNRADFSQYNSEVDLVAPGQTILSTAPLGFGALFEVQVPGGTGYSTSLLGESVSPSTDQLSGQLVECPNLGQDVCPGGGSHICLIERGVSYFEEKALNCERSGGIAAMIYNNEPGFFAGGLASPTSVTIPVFALTQEDGLDLLQNYDGATITLVMQDGYAIADGTSFASPFVAGAAAAIWQSCPACRRDDVESCLLTTALDLGNQGRDDEYGHGLVQVEDAYLCLVETIGCCVETPTSPTTPSPVPPPTSPTAPTTRPCFEQETAYRQCFSTEFESVVDIGTCRTCINGALPEDMDSTSCEELQNSVCAATRGGCRCSSCSSSIEDYLVCLMQESTGGSCTIDCDAYEANEPSSLDIQVCTEQEADMVSCLRVTPSDGSTPQQANDCSSCILGSLPATFSGNTCDEVNQKMCPVPENCSCDRCRIEIESFLDCVIDINTVGCNLDCESDNSVISAAPIQNEWTGGFRWLLMLSVFGVGALIM